MFIPLNIDDFDKYFFLIIPKNFSRDKFLSKSKIMNATYANKIINDILDVFENSTVDVIDEYNKYYSMEYSDVFDYLYKHYNLTEDSLCFVKQNMSDDTKLLFGSATSSGGYNLAELMFDEKMVVAINKLLEEIKHEN